jgi:hypothetical protein
LKAFQTKVLGRQEVASTTLCQINVYKEECRLTGVEGKDQIAEDVLAQPSKQMFLYLDPSMQLSGHTDTSKKICCFGKV